VTRKKAQRPGRPSAPGWIVPGHGDTVLGLPEGTRVLAWDGGTRYLITDGTTTRGRTTAWVVDTATGTASPPLAIDSPLVQTDPDEWIVPNLDSDPGDADWLKGRKR
jgi:hypothetical protein